MNEEVFQEEMLQISILKCSIKSTKKILLIFQSTFDTIVHKKGNMENADLNFDSLSLYLEHKFPDRLNSDNSTDISDLLESLISHGYSMIQTLDEQIDKGILAFYAYEEDAYDEKYFSKTGVVRSILCMLNKKFEKHIFPLSKKNEDKYAPYRHLINND